MNGLEVFFLLPNEVCLRLCCPRQGQQGQQGETSCTEVKRSWCPPGGHLAHCVDALKIRNKTKYPSQPVSFLEPFYLHQGSEASKGRQASGGQEGGTGVVFASEDRGEQLLKGELSRSIVFVMRIDTNKGFPTKHTHSPVLTAYPLEGRAVHWALETL